MAGEWALKRLGEICEFRGGQGFPHKHQGAVVGEYPFIKVSDMELSGNRHRITRANHWIDEATRKELRAKPHPATSTVFAKIGVALTYNRRRLLSRPTIVDNNMMAAVPIESEVDPLFLYYLLKITDFNEVVSGTALPFINGSDLAKMEVVTPPLPEQRAIAHVLGTLDDLIELNRETNEILEEMARALFKSWFVDFDPVRAKLEGRQPAGMDAATAALFPDHFEDSELGQIPKGWKAIPLYDTAKYINGAAFKSDDFCAPGVGLPVIKIGELKQGVTEQTKWSEREAGDNQIIDTGDLVYSWSGSPDTSLDAFLWCHGRGLLNQHIFKIVAPSVAQKHFVYYLLQYLRPVLVDTAKNKQTTGLGHVTVADMKRILVCWPGEEVLEAFDQIIGPIFDSAFEATLESRDLATLRDTLLPKLLSGEVKAPAAKEVAHE